ncbi:phosphoribosylformylglycinamidine cyclo-ligase [Candidatus Epulonipiscium viviparus]|uniref:phosphoribosylformylglycinamidine cyclo-ligase n=1 Tax=Candidatus Epulonipiscium viviparus TaxID=420336 RepID=UPI002FE6E90F
MTYKDAGVDVTRGYAAVAAISEKVKSTFTSGVLTDIGSFGGAFSLAAFKGMEEPVLVSGTDGIGTKLKLAFMMNKHDTIGIDCVAMCVNDILCSGATPLFFLDYIATGTISPNAIAEIVSGISQGCIESGCALIGGETAEMPGFYKTGEYDVAGFCVGIVDKKDMIDGKNLKEGDVLIGLASSGIHSNGYSLVRKLVDITKIDLNEYSEDLAQTYGEALLKPTRLYVNSILALKKDVTIKGMAHITGGGFIENIPRMFSSDLSAKIDLETIKKPAIYKFIEKASNLTQKELYNTFNMGIGMVVAVGREDAAKSIAILAEAGEVATIIGEIVPGNKEVIF